MTNKEREQEKRREWLRLAAIGPHFLATTLIGFGIGYKIDQWSGTGEIWTIIFSMLGIAAGFLNLFRELSLVNAAEERRRREDEAENAEATEEEQS
jgi:ATP synthase protein I